MKFFTKMKDGGKDSPVDSYTLFEIKSLGSVMALKFNKGGRENFHSHAFNAYTWFISGSLVEEKVDGSLYQYKKSVIPKYTGRDNCHRVVAKKDSWCLTVRGPWCEKWYELTPEKDKKINLTYGRVVTSEEALPQEPDA